MNLRNGREDKDNEKHLLETNVRAILASFYLGTGADDIGNALSFMGVPGGHSWKNHFFRHSEEVNSKIIGLGEEIVREGLEGEITSVIKEKLGDKYSTADVDKYISNFFNDEPDIPVDILTIGLTVSYDMGWQKRSAGRIYDSLSGHGFMIGCNTGKVVAVAVRAKKCNKCTIANRKEVESKAHYCPVNHDGSSGSMEAIVALYLTTDVHTNSKGKVYIEALVSDDDFTMRMLLKHKDNHPKGKLSCMIPQPTFLADPSHRIKVMAKPFFLMVTKTKDPRKCKTIDALRIKKYLGCFIYKNRHLPLAEFVMRSRAPVEHLFNCHEWCDSDWCWAKSLTEQSQDAVKNRATQVT